MYEEVRILITDEMRLQTDRVRRSANTLTKLYVTGRTHAPTLFPLPPLVSSRLVFSSLLAPSFCFLFLNSLFRKNLYTQRCTQHMNIPRRYSQQCFCKGIILIFFIIKMSPNNGVLLHRKMLKKVAIHRHDR